MAEPLPERDQMEFDVVIVGAGPAGLAAAIRLKQVAAERGQDISVVVLEKGAEVGAHILSGLVMDPVGMDRLLPDWRTNNPPLTTQVTVDKFLYIGPAGEMLLPHILMPPLMSNKGCFVGSLGNVCRYLATRAEELGVDIYPGFAASEMLYDAGGSVIGVATGDMGVGRDGQPHAGFARGMALMGKYVLIAEGVRGSLAKQVIAKFGLDKGRDPQKFGLGMKELWELAPDKHRPGLVQHTMGWPLDNRTGGGSFIYHFGENLASVGFVVHLNYENPYLSPYEEFQRFKTHPAIRPMLEGGRRIAYGARAISEGGLQAIPQLVFPGGALLGCSAGLVNVPRIKGSHNAILSGMLAAEAVADALAAGRSKDVLKAYQTGFWASDIAAELRKVRNVKPLWSRFGTAAGVALGGIDMWLNTAFPFLRYTLSHGKPDHATLKPAEQSQPITYQKPDGVVTFDRLSSVFLSGTNHEEDQPVHLKVGDASLHYRSEFAIYGGPSQRYCPAGVYEWLEEDRDGVKARFQINAQNCVHCKTCDIKDPNQNITWVTPEGGGGPTYPNM